MKNNFKHIATIVIALTFVVTARSQDIHFSQFFETPLLRNPSLAGLFTGDIRFQGTFRDQWQSVTSAYKTGTLSGEYKIPVKRGDDFVTVGGQILYDKAGSIGWSSTHVLPTINYHKSMSNDKNRFLSMGVSVGYINRNFDRSKMTTNSQYETGDLGENFPTQSISYFDGSIGLSYNATIGDNDNNNFYIGAAYHHLNKPNYSFYRNPSVGLKPKWVGSAGLRVDVAEQSYLSVLGDFSLQGEYKELIVGTMFGMKIGDDLQNPKYTVHLGSFWRWNDALIPVVKFDYHPYSVTLSYDANISALKPSSFGRGGFELTLSYTGFTNRGKTADYLLCPRF